MVPEESLLVDCKVSPPPTRQELVDADPITRQQLYARAWHAQLESVDACNSRLKALREWRRAQLAAEEELNQ